MVGMLLHPVIRVRLPWLSKHRADFPVQSWEIAVALSPQGLVKVQCTRSAMRPKDMVKISSRKVRVNRSSLLTLEKKKDLQESVPQVLKWLLVCDHVLLRAESDLIIWWATVCASVNMHWTLQYIHYLCLNHGKYIRALILLLSNAREYIYTVPCQNGIFIHKENEKSKNII